MRDAMPDYEFYRGCYEGQSLTEEEFFRQRGEAAAQLDRLGRLYQLTPLPQLDEEEARKRAICRMAEVLAYFDWAENGGVSKGLSVGSVAQTGSPLPELSPAARSAQLYRAAGLSYTIFRGCGG